MSERMFKMSRNAINHRRYLDRLRTNAPERYVTRVKQSSDWNKAHLDIMRVKLKKWKIVHPGRHDELTNAWRNAHPEKAIKYKAKREQRGFVPLIKNDWNCPVDWHHVSPNRPYVIPIPRDVHRVRYGKSHFVFNAAVASQLFGLNLKGDVSL